MLPPAQTLPHSEASPVQGRLAWYRATVKLLVVMLLAACGSASPPPSPVGNTAAPAPQVTETETDTIPYTGNPAARVQLVSYFNYQCSHCVAFAPTLDEIAARYGNKIVIQHRVLRLPNHGPDNDLPHIAALAAHRQGRFEAMHRALFAGGVFDRESVIGYARTIGLDVPRFTRDLSDPKLRARIDADSRAADRDRVAGVPAVLIDGREYHGDPTIAPISAAIDAALAK